MRTRSKFMILAAALVGLLLVPAVAMANTIDRSDLSLEEFTAIYGPGEGDFITCVTEGTDTVSCEAGLFDAGTTVTWEAAYNPTIATGTATVAADETASFDFDASGVPSGTDIYVLVSGTYNGVPKVLADTAAVVDPDGEVIGNAGAEAALLAAGALGAIALGGAALFVSRRKRATVA